MKLKPLSFLLAAPLWAQAVSFTLTCTNCPTAIVGGSTFNLAVNYGPDSSPLNSANLLALAMPVDVASYTVAAGPIATAAGKLLSQSGNVILLIGSGNPPTNTPTLNAGSGVMLNVAVTMKPTITQASQVFGLPLAVSANTSGVAIPTTGTGVTLPATITPPPISKCDKNQDGAINLADLTLIDTWVLAAAQPGGVAAAGCDSNADGKCDVTDSMIVLLSVIDPAHTCLAK